MLLITCRDNQDIANDSTSDQRVECAAEYQDRCLDGNPTGHDMHQMTGTSGPAKVLVGRGNVLSVLQAGLEPLLTPEPATRMTTPRAYGCLPDCESTLAVSRQPPRRVCTSLDTATVPCCCRYGHPSTADPPPAAGARDPPGVRRASPGLAPMARPVCRQSTAFTNQQPLRQSSGRDPHTGVFERRVRSRRVAS